MYCIYKSAQIPVSLAEITAFLGTFLADPLKFSQIEWKAFVITIFRSLHLGFGRAIRWHSVTCPETTPVLFWLYASSCHVKRGICIHSSLNSAQFPSPYC